MVEQMGNKMIVSKEIEQRVRNEIQRCIDVAKKHYNREFAFPTYDFSVRGNTAGYARPSTNHLMFNAIFLNNHTDQFITRTVVHEVAHLIDRAVNGYEYTRSGKRIVHGNNWKNVMRVLGAKDITRCHNYDTSKSQTKVKNKFHYQCQKCGAGIFLGPVRHRNQQQRSQYRHARCGGSLDFVKKLGQVTYHEARNGKKEQHPKQTKQPKSNSKKAQALLLYKLNSHISTKAMIQLFMSELNMTVAGARTYVSNCRNEIAK